MTRAHSTAPDAGTTRDDLTRLRPDLLDRYDAALPGAHAAILTRLWGAIAREPIPGLGTRTTRGDRLTVALPGGGTLDGPVTAPFAPPQGPVHGPDGPITDPVHLARITGMGDAFRTELANSVANLALARADAHPAPTLVG